MYRSSQKLWKIIKQPDGYYYVIKLKGVVIDMVKVSKTSETYLKCEGVIE